MAHAPEYAIRLDFERALGTRMVIVNPSKISISVGSARTSLIISSFVDFVASKGKNMSR